MRQYIALIHKDPDSDYGVSFPDLPGVISAGSTLDEALDMATEALAFHLEGLAEDDEAVPEPSTLQEIMAISENRDGVAILIPAPDANIRSVRVKTSPRHCERSEAIQGHKEELDCFAALAMTQ
jgi:predicted RNase H-like HicB family nuclease